MEGCGEHWGVQAQQIVEMMKMLQFIRVGNVAAVPGDEDVASVPCGEGEVAGVAGEAGGHEPVADVEFHGLIDLGGILENGQAAGQCEAVGALGFGGEFEFGEDGVGGRELMLRCGLRPPFARPVAHGDDVGLGARLVVKARDRGFDVNEFAHRNQLERFISN